MSHPASGALRALGADLIRLQPAPGAGRRAARAAATMLIALVVLGGSGRLDLALYASFGAFAAVYGAGLPYAGRWRVQAGTGAVLTVAVTAGALVGLSPERAWLSVPVTAASAALAAWLSDRFSWRPPGPLFVVFAVSASGSIATHPTLLAAAVLAASATAAVAVVIGLLETAWARSRGGLAAAPGPLPVRPGRQRVHVLRCAAAVVVAGLVATASGIGHPYWAMMTAVVPLSAFDLRHQTVRALHRVLGTAFGLLLALALLSLPRSVGATILLVVALQAAVEALVARNYGLALIGVTALALLLGQLAAPQPVGSLLLQRLLETLIGVAVGVTAAVLTRARPPGPGAQLKR